MGYRKGKVMQPSSGNINLIDIDRQEIPNEISSKLKVEVSIKDTDVFSNVIQLIDDILHDERVPIEAINDYLTKLENIISDVKV